MSAPAASRLPEDHPAWRDLRPLGYECSRWVAAMGMLQTRFRKGRFGEPLNTFLQTWMPEEPVPAPEETFEVSRTAGGLRAGSNLQVLNDPLWQALLHLPALRDFWTAELRASHHAHLLQIVPRAWCMDLAPLPPGSVIAGLDIGNWEELPAWEAASGRSLTRHAAGENKVVLTETSAIDDLWRARYTRRDGQIVLEDAFLA